MTKLTKSNILLSIQGKYGGFTIAKPIRKIKIIDIIGVFDDIDTQICVLTDKICNADKICILHNTWEKPRCTINNLFENTTLYNLVKNIKYYKLINTAD